MITGVLVELEVDEPGRACVKTRTLEGRNTYAT